MIIFTSICANYLHKARTLAKSVKEHMPDANFIVCLVENEAGAAGNCEYFDRVVLAKEAWEENFDEFMYGGHIIKASDKVYFERFIFKHSIVEASTAVKGQFFRYLFTDYPQEDKFIYLDPDTYVYADLVELRERLDTRPIVVCPHLLQPGNIDMELSCIIHGAYNLGFLAINRSVEAKKFIDWWANRLYLFCYDDKANNMFTDQKWIDLAPCFFDVEVLKHRGYDFAPWSLLDSGMTVNDDDRIAIRGDELRFIHFSGYGLVAETCMRKWLSPGDHPFRRLYAAYSIVHDANDADETSKTKWSYGHYDSGKKISNRVRKLYRNDYNIMLSVENPFRYSNFYFTKGIFAKTIVHNIAVKYQKSIETYQRQGLKALMKKICEFILKK
jgi:hypothetical protein